MRALLCARSFFFSHTRTSLYVYLQQKLYTSALSLFDNSIHSAPPIHIQHARVRRRAMGCSFTSLSLAILEVQAKGSAPHFWGLEPSSHGRPIRLPFAYHGSCHFSFWKGREHE
ncbi:hypothetical protein BCR43DRAFT_497265 [Syncephalastrum racemosum]|uniref:Uncharacterized protein n=1 Tax=Syncephalastrum racemosum TaxID=13706 RepID=A0A1X2H5G4_SYNRA|nr:hypothetical protein BCR43DRAFT_497265 [Syncephalastrum racemosum]